MEGKRMTVQDDLHRLGQLDGIYLGWSVLNTTDLANAPPLVTIRYKGKLQQANDGNWIFRSISADGTVVGFQLGPVSPSWTSNENPAVATVYLQQQLPQEMTN
jgi:hypothetical protein